MRPAKRKPVSRLHIYNALAAASPELGNDLMESIYLRVHDLVFALSTLTAGKRLCYTDVNPSPFRKPIPSPVNPD